MHISDTCYINNLLSSYERQTMRWIAHPGFIIGTQNHAAPNFSPFVLIVTVLVGNGAASPQSWNCSGSPSTRVHSIVMVELGDADGLVAWSVMAVDKWVRRERIVIVVTELVVRFC
jgi:hypothetical protein